MLLCGIGIKETSYVTRLQVIELGIPEERRDNMKETSKRRILIISAIAIVVVIIVVAAIVVNGSGSKNNLRDQLDLAEQYLSDMDYEQAIAAYEQALEIEPKCEEAYLGLADIYVTLEDYDNALEILNEGYEQTGADSIAEKIEEIQNLLAESETEAEADTSTQQDDTTYDIVIDYTFDITTVDVTIYGKKIYEWTPEELMQYIYDTGIYDKSKETYEGMTEGDGYTTNDYSIENLGYVAHRVVFDSGLETVDLDFDNYGLGIAVSGDGGGWVDIIAWGTYGLPDVTDNIQNNIMGRTLYDFFGNEDLVDALQRQESIKCNNTDISAYFENDSLQCVNIENWSYSGDLYRIGILVDDNGVIDSIWVDYR
jgi:tetratricopeptide (TPR) repeat protein